MYRDLARSKLFTRRAALLYGGNLALSLVLAGRMYQLQVIQSDRYKTLAEENRIHMRLLPPLRGRILDRFGAPLAVNRDNYRVLLVAEQTPDVVATLDALSEIIGLDEAERRRVVRELKRRRGFVPVTLRDNLSWEEVARIEVRAPDLPGVMIDVGQSREYSYGAEMAHVLGYVAAVSEREQRGDPLLELPGFRIGKNGIEKVLDLELRGKAGASQLEVNAVGRVIRELKRQEGVPGRDIRLTLDLGLQRFTAKRLADARSASAVLLDVTNGEVLAMVSVPGFDPNAFNIGLSERDWKGLVGDPHAPLINKAIAGQYAPGSVYKMITGLAALEAGVIGPEERVFCSGSVALGNARFHCWKKHGHGWMDLRGALAQSCDTYFYEVARRTGIDRIAGMARRFGLGVRPGFEIPGAKAGLVPTKRWKRGAKGVPWQLGETLIAGIGQGFVLATPLQLAVMTARIANGGRAVEPHLLRQPAPDGAADAANAPPPVGVSAAALQVIVEGMQAVTADQRGTAFAARIKEPGMGMAGKTGTSQVRRISKYERDTRVLKNEELPWRQRDHAVFVGFAPMESPRYAAAVVVEHGGGGSKVAAPIARDILREAQRRDPAGKGAPSRMAAGGRERGSG